MNRDSSNTASQTSQEESYSHNAAQIDVDDQYFHKDSNLISDCFYSDSFPPPSSLLKEETYFVGCDPKLYQES